MLHRAHVMPLHVKLRIMGQAILDSPPDNSPGNDKTVRFRDKLAVYCPRGMPERSPVVFRGIRNGLNLILAEPFPQIDILTYYTRRHDMVSLPVLAKPCIMERSSGIDHGGVDIIMHTERHSLAYHRLSMVPAMPFVKMVIPGNNLFCNILTQSWVFFFLYHTGLNLLPPTKGPEMANDGATGTVQGNRNAKIDISARFHST